MLFASFVVRSGTASFVAHYYWEVLCASFVVQSSTGKYFVQALYKVVLGSALRKLGSTK